MYSHYVIVTLALISETGEPTFIMSVANMNINVVLWFWIVSVMIHGDVIGLLLHR